MFNEITYGLEVFLFLKYYIAGSIRYSDIPEIYEQTYSYFSAFSLKFVAGS